MIHDHTPFSPASPSPRGPRRFPREWPAGQERYTEEITACSPAQRARNVIAIDHMELVEAESSPVPGRAASERAASQTCDYHEGNYAAPNNNLFFEERSNPLSSKGNWQRIGYEAETYIPWSPNWPRIGYHRKRIRPSRILHRRQVHLRHISLLPTCDPARRVPAYP